MAAPVPFTAVGAAFLRAAHLTEDGTPKIFQDTLAHALVGRELATRLEDVLGRPGRQRSFQWRGSPW